MVPLSNAWRSGARNWSTAQREAFANDLTRPQLIAVEDSASCLSCLRRANVADEVRRCEPDQIGSGARGLVACSHELPLHVCARVGAGQVLL